MNDKAVENIEELMKSLTVLPEQEFDEALASVGALIACTLKDRHGRRFLKDFMRAAIEDTGEQPILVWQGPAH